MGMANQLTLTLSASKLAAHQGDKYIVLWKAGTVSRMAVNCQAKNWTLIRKNNNFLPLSPPSQSKNSLYAPVHKKLTSR